jgi:hypothetical protein
MRDYFKAELRRQKSEVRPGLILLILLILSIKNMADGGWRMAKGFVP